MDAEEIAERGVRISQALDLGVADAGLFMEAGELLEDCGVVMLRVLTHGISVTCFIADLPCVLDFAVDHVAFAFFTRPNE